MRWDETGEGPRTLRLYGWNLHWLWNLVILMLWDITAIFLWPLQEKTCSCHQLHCFWFSNIQQQWVRLGKAKLRGHNWLIFWTFFLAKGYVESKYSSYSCKSSVECYFFGWYVAVYAHTVVRISCHMWGLQTPFNYCQHLPVDLEFSGISRTDLKMPLLTKLRCSLLWLLRAEYVYYCQIVVITFHGLLNRSPLLCPLYYNEYHCQANLHLYSDFPPVSARQHHSPLSPVNPCPCAHSFFISFLPNVLSSCHREDEMYSRLSCH